MWTLMRAAVMLLALTPFLSHAADVPGPQVGLSVDGYEEGVFPNDLSIYGGGDVGVGDIRQNPYRGFIPFVRVGNTIVLSDVRIHWQEFPLVSVRASDIFGHGKTATHLLWEKRERSFIESAAVVAGREWRYDPETERDLYPVYDKDTRIGYLSYIKIPYAYTMYDADDMESKYFTPVYSVVIQIDRPPLPSRFR